MQGFLKRNLKKDRTVEHSKAGINKFEKHRKKTIVAIVLFVASLLIGVTEIFLEKFMGLGNPVIYSSYPLYGYRPLPEKEYSRFWGAKIQFNNLGLRAETDWDENIEDKILFLGDSVTYGGSSVDDTELVSFLSVKSLGGSYISGNAGVNAWGVENVYGLIVESNFLPARVYVTTFPERDFYRGLVRMQGLPFFNKDPGFALEELWYYFCYKQNNNRYEHWQSYASEQAKTLVVEKAVQKLKKMDVFLKERGYKHLILITPERKQVTEGVEKDSLVNDLLVKYELFPDYILDEINKLNLSKKEMEDSYLDDIHLTKTGNRIWSGIVASRLRELLSE
jgi:hypothetical protein